MPIGVFTAPTSLESNVTYTYVPGEINLLSTVNGVSSAILEFNGHVAMNIIPINAIQSHTNPVDIGTEKVDSNRKDWDAWTWILINYEPPTFYRY